MSRRLSSLLPILLFVFPFIALAAAPSQRTVDLTSSDGTKLKATYFPATKPGPGVLLLHQCNQDRKIWGDLPAQLATSGIHVLTFDLRNFGESEGKPYLELTPQERQAAVRNWPTDIDAAYAYLSSQPGVKRDVIGLAGASCGVY